MTTLPEKGVPRDELFGRMRERKQQDADWRGGKTWSLIYPAGEEVDEILRDECSGQPRTEIELISASPLANAAG